MPSDNLHTHQTSSERKFRVGWQKLTQQEFLEALTAALIEKVDDHRRNRHLLSSALRDSLPTIGFSDPAD